MVVPFRGENAGFSLSPSHAPLNLIIDQIAYDPVRVDKTNDINSRHALTAC